MRVLIVALVQVLFDLVQVLVDLVQVHVDLVQAHSPQGGLKRVVRSQDGVGPGFGLAGAVCEGVRRGQVCCSKVGWGESARSGPEGSVYIDTYTATGAQEWGFGASKNK